jgi:hypothetical protein
MTAKSHLRNAFVAALFEPVRSNRIGATRPGKASTKARELSYEHNDRLLLP